jgi:threonine/homoserine/homoserine lactone efflux protein
MAVTGASAFLPAQQSAVMAVGLLCTVFCLVNFCCISVWAGGGAALRRCLADVRWQRLFCAAMMILTSYAALSLWR